MGEATDRFLSKVSPQLRHEVALMHDTLLALSAYSDDAIIALSAPQDELMVALAMTPGGRVGDDSSLDASPKKNWVENAGGLPKYIRMVAHAMIKKGHDKSKAIGMAVGIVRNWAEGKGDVTPKVRAAAQKAIAEWEAKKASTKVKK